MLPGPSSRHPTARLAGTESTRDYVAASTIASLSCCNGASIPTETVHPQFDLAAGPGWKLQSDTSRPPASHSRWSACFRHSRCSQKHRAHSGLDCVGRFQCGPSHCTPAQRIERHGVPPPWMPSTLR